MMTNTITTMTITTIMATITNMRHKWICATGFLCLCLFAIAAIQPQPAQAEMMQAQAQMAETENAELEKFIEDYLLTHPDVLVKALNNAQTYAQEQEAREKLALVRTHAQALYSDKRDFSLGTEDAPITIVEFFDYNCGYCRRAFPNLLRLAENNKDVRIVFKELPILGADSNAAAQIALTAIPQGRYFDLHSAFLEQKSRLSAARAEQIAASLGLKKTKQERKRKGVSLQKHLDDNRALAQTLGISGTPGFIIADKIYYGAIPYEDMQQAVDEARQNL